MNQMTSMKITADNLISVHISVLCTETSEWDTKPFLQNDDGVRKTFSMFKIRSEIFSQCTKSSPALVPWIKNDHFIACMQTV